MFEVPRSKRSKSQNQFEFRFPDDDRTFNVPLLQYIRPALALEFTNGNDVAAVKALFNEYLGDSFGMFEDSEQLQAFMAAWQQASGVSMGESPASAS